MKNKGTVILLAVTISFILLIIGFLIGRNIDGDKTVISYEPIVTGAKEDVIVSVSDGKLNINNADISALCELPGIGEILASRIVAFREENGKFIHTTDLMQVEGIGEKIFLSIADLISVGG